MANVQHLLFRKEFGSFYFLVSSSQYAAVACTIANDTAIPKPKPVLRKSASV